MQRNFILTDVMKTGYHQDLEGYINMHTLEKQSFDCTGEYYTLHQYDLDSYDRRIAIIDTRSTNKRINGKTFNDDLRKRYDLLHSQGFHFIKANPWESLYNMEEKGHTPYPVIDIPHIKWTGGVSWFWFYMYRKHSGKQYNFDHSSKKYDFLYLNKTAREHRVKLYNKLKEVGILSNSLSTFHNLDNTTLPQKYELPGVIDYPYRGLDQDIFELPYNDTKFSLVSETNDVTNEVFMTEKIWKPIIAGHMFVVHGNPLYLQKLRELGFKTFNNYFDESYDLEENKNTRIDKIVKLCNELKDCYWEDMYMLSKGLRQHNTDLFFNKEKLSEEVNKQLNLFLEFVDGSKISS